MAVFEIIGDFLERIGDAIDRALDVAGKTVDKVREVITDFFWERVFPLGVKLLQLFVVILFFVYLRAIGFELNGLPKTNGLVWFIGVVGIIIQITGTLFIYGIPLAVLVFSFRPSNPVKSVDAPPEEPELAKSADVPPKWRARRERDNQPRFPLRVRYQPKSVDDRKRLHPGRFFILDLLVVLGVALFTSISEYQFKSGPLSITQSSIEWMVQHVGHLSSPAPRTRTEIHQQNMSQQTNLKGANQPPSDESGTLSQKSGETGAPSASDAIGRGFGTTTVSTPGPQGTIFAQGLELPAGAQQSNSSNCLRYGEQVTMEGRLEHRDRNGYYPYEAFVPDKLICTAHGGDYEPAEQNIAEFQASAPNGEWDRVYGMVGSRVLVVGKLDHGVNVHHHTAVMLLTDVMEPIGSDDGAAERFLSELKNVTGYDIDVIAGETLTKQVRASDSKTEILPTDAYVSDWNNAVDTIFLGCRNGFDIQNYSATPKNAVSSCKEDPTKQLCFTRPSQGTIRIVMHCVKEP